MLGSFFNVDPDRMLGSFFTVLNVAVAAYDTILGNHPTHLQSLFGPHLSHGAEIAAASDANFSSVVGPRWSSWENPKWSGAIKPATVHDIQEIVKISVKHDIPFFATSGGHGPKIGLGQFTGININLANFNSVTVDAAANRMTLGAGTKLGEMNTAVFNAGKELQTGNSWCPGAIGVMVGGGIGMLTGKHGLMTDALLSATLVTATGELVTASKEENPDLFWAIRGAGANFGIIVEATFELHELTNNGNVIEGNFFYPGATNRTLWELMATFDDVLPVNLAVQIGMLYNQTTSQSMLWAQMWYMGPEEEAQVYLDKFAALGPIATEILHLTQVEVYYQSITRGVCDMGHAITAYTTGFRRTDVKAFEAHFADFVSFSAANRAYAGVSFVQWYSNKGMNKHPAEESVYPWRDVQAWWLLENIYLDPSLEPKIAAWSVDQRKKLHATSGFDEPRVYVNYAIGDEGPEAWWSAKNLPKLREVKEKWDPTNLFGLGAAIP